MKIRRLILHQVACFEHADISFPEGSDAKKADIHLLVGPNGTGKSTILLALAQLLTRQSLGFDRRLWGNDSFVVIQTADGALAGARLATSPERADVLSVGGLGDLTPHYDSGPLLFLQPRSNSRIEEHRVAASGFRPLDLRYARTRFSFAAFAYSGLRSISGYKIDSIKELEDGPLSDSCSFVHVGAPGRFVQWVANTKTKEALALARQDVEAANLRRETLQRVESVLQRVTGLPFTLVMHEEPLGVGFKMNGKVLDLDLLPDGMKSILSWVGDLLMRMDRVPWEGDVPILDRPFALFLDEIEVHLHPAWQRKLLPTVQDLFPNAQIFLSTHSPFIVASASDAWIHPLRLEGGRALVDPPLSSRIGSSYESILREVLGVPEEFDVETEALFKRFYELKAQALARAAGAMEQLESVAKDLRKRGVETTAIVEREMRQIARLLAHGTPTR